MSPGDEVALVTAHPGAVAWLLSGSRGLSARSMFRTITGWAVEGDRLYHPYDAGDFSRCMALLDTVPSLRLELWRMSDVGPEWEALVSAWKHIEELVHNDGSAWSGAANVLVRELLKDARDD